MSDRIKVTPSQLRVLRSAKARNVYRSERGHDLYTCYDSGKKVTAIVSRLVTLGLLSIGERKLLQRLWHVTEQGDQVLSRYP